MAKKPARTLVNQMSRQKKSVILLVVGFVSIFALGVIATYALMSHRSVNGEATLIHRQVEIKTTDGLMGLIGEQISLKPGQLAVYQVTYTNDSSNDMVISIKATQREHDFSEKWCEGAYCDLGAWTGSVYSEKKTVKKGQTVDFTVPVTPLGKTATGSVELEAFKANDAGLTN